jgi:hypothetical protein
MEDGFKCGGKKSFSSIGTELIHLFEHCMNLGTSHDDLQTGQNCDGLKSCWTGGQRSL